MLFFVLKPDICNFADDRRISSCGKILGVIAQSQVWPKACFKMIQGKSIKTKSWLVSDFNS